MHRHIFNGVRSFTASHIGQTLIVLCTTLFAIGGVFYRLVEGWSWIDSFYFTVVTLTTVGYGDITPETAAGKIFTMVYILIGIGVLVALVTEIGNNIVASRESTDIEDS